MQFEDPSGALMMLPSDIVLVQDKGFRPYVVEYAKSFLSPPTATLAHMHVWGVSFHLSHSQVRQEQRRIRKGLRLGVHEAHGARHKGPHASRALIGTRNQSVIKA
jgi:hypothetical protein